MDHIRLLISLLHRNYDPIVYNFSDIAIHWSKIGYPVGATPLKYYYIQIFGVRKQESHALLPGVDFLTIGSQ